jgi:nucleotide-binding universal stress UspA family protein
MNTRTFDFAKLPFRRILVPVDFGELSRPALKEAVALAQYSGASVTLLHVYEYSLFGLDGGPTSTIDAARQLRQAAEDSLRELVALYVSQKVQIISVLREGLPWTEVLRYAKESGADLIVLGTHGRRGLPRALLGSVAEKIVRSARIPVLTIHAPSPAQDDRAERHDATPALVNSHRTASPEAKLQGSRHAEEILAVSGAVAGAATGAIAGPPGMAAGLVLGAAMGMAAGATLDREDVRQHEHDEELDRELGISGGNLGSASPSQPAARVGAYSAGSAGAGSPSGCPSEGPMQALDDD